MPKGKYNQVLQLALDKFLMLEILCDFPICPDLEKKNQLEGTSEF